MPAHRESLFCALVSPTRCGRIIVPVPAGVKKWRPHAPSRTHSGRRPPAGAPAHDSAKIMNPWGAARPARRIRSRPGSLCCGLAGGGTTMFGSIGGPELLVIFVIALLIFGPKKLSELGRTVGKGVAEFRKAASDLRDTLDAEVSRAGTTPPKDRILTAPGE